MGAALDPSFVEYAESLEAFHVDYQSSRHLGCRRLPYHLKMDRVRHLLLVTQAWSTSNYRSTYGLRDYGGAVLLCNVVDGVGQQDVAARWRIQAST